MPTEQPSPETIAAAEAIVTAAANGEDPAALLEAVPRPVQIFTRQPKVSPS